MKKIEPFPITAVVGLEQAKRSLIYHAIDPRLGGALLVGHRGCAKTTLARAFAELLPGDGLFVEIPLGTTEDRLLGSVHAQALVEKSTWGVQTGLIEQAHGGVLYVDEINLLPDHLADLILDSAATGQYRMERDGIAREVESRYVLVGTMNPEEGELRPQLSDRFAHCIKISDGFSAEERMEAVRRRIEFDDDPGLFRAQFADETKDLQAKILQARQTVNKIVVSPEIRKAVAEKARALVVEGLRAELAVVRTARAAAAWHGRTEVDGADLAEAWELCRGHRQRDEGRDHTSPGKRPEIPESKTNGKNGGASSNPARPSASTAMTPREADPHSHPLTQEKKQTGGELLRWWRSEARVQDRSQNRPVKRERLLTRRTSSTDSIAWLASICKSWTRGWRPGKPEFELMYYAANLRHSLWIFLDASRSTGANRFLGKAREEIKALARELKAWRFEILLLRGGRIDWIFRRGNREGAVRALDGLPEASGKSLLVESLNRLTRARLQRGASAGDRIVLCSDGFVSPKKNESGSIAKLFMFNELRRISEQAASSFAWLHPVPPRGLRGYLPGLCRGLKAELIEVCLAGSRR